MFAFKQKYAIQILVVKRDCHHCFAEKRNLLLPVYVIDNCKHGYNVKVLERENIHNDDTFVPIHLLLHFNMVMWFIIVGAVRDEDSFPDLQILLRVLDNLPQMEGNWYRFVKFTPFYHFNIDFLKQKYIWWQHELQSYPSCIYQYLFQKHQ